MEVKTFKNFGHGRRLVAPYYFFEPISHLRKETLLGLDLSQRLPDDKDTMNADRPGNAC